MKDYSVAIQSSVSVLFFTDLHYFFVWCRVGRERVYNLKHIYSVLPAFEGQYFGQSFEVPSTVAFLHWLESSGLHVLPILNGPAAPSHFFSHSPSLAFHSVKEIETPKSNITDNGCFHTRRRTNRLDGQVVWRFVHLSSVKARQTSHLVLAVLLIWRGKDKRFWTQRTWNTHKSILPLLPVWGQNTTICSSSVNLGRFNPRTYKQTHTPNVVQGGGGGW